MDAAGWDDRYRDSELLWSAGPNGFLPEIIQDLTPGTALDLACGEGRNSIWLAQQGWNVTGVDFSSVAIDKATDWADRTGLSVNFLVEDLATWFAQHSFDLIVELYFHVPRELRKEIHRNTEQFVAPGGAYVVLGHHIDNLVDGVGGPQMPDVLFSPADIAADFGTLIQVKAQRLERSTAAGTAIDALYVGTNRLGVLTTPK